MKRFTIIFGWGIRLRWEKEALYITDRQGYRNIMWLTLSTFVKGNQRAHRFILWRFMIEIANTKNVQ